MIKRVLETAYPIGYRILYAIILSGTVITGLGSFVGVSEITVFHVLVWSVAIGMLVFINYGGTNLKIISVCVFVLLMGIILPLQGEGEMFGFYKDYISWLRGTGTFLPEKCVGYQLVQIVLISIGGYLAAALMEKRKIIRDIAGVCVLSGLLVCLFQKEKVGAMGVVFAILFILLCYVERLQDYWKRRKFRDGREYILWLTPFLVLYFLLVQCLPTPAEPYGWPVMKKIYANVSEKISLFVENLMWDGEDDFGIAMTGFSEDAGISGDVVENRRHVLTIYRERGKKINVYLTGKTYDTFDGQKWNQTIENTLREMPFDRLETEYAVRRREGSLFTNYIYLSKLTISYERLKTAYLFAPGKLYSVGNAEYVYNGRDLMFKEKRKKGTSYDVSYFQLNAANPEFYDMLMTVKEDDEAVWEDVLQTYSLSDNEAFSMEALKDYRKQIEQIYGGEVLLSPELEIYLQEVYDGCQNDIEKLQALERELASYVYTTSPGDYPKDIDSPEEFLEFFMLDKKQGYCSYFATAFVLLARDLGYPARYVQGYCVPMTAETEAEVNSNMIHAWPEVYVEGVGWIAFEPTPGYGAIRNKGWKVKVAEEETALPEESDDQKQEREQEEQETVEPEGPSEEEIRELWAKRLRILAIGVLVVGATGVLTLWIESILLKRKYSRMTTEQKFLVEVARNLWLCEKLGCKRAESETLSELQDKLCERFPDLLKEKQEFVFMQYYQEYLYRCDMVQEEVLEQSILEREALLKSIRQERRWYYLFLRIKLFYKY